MAKKKINRNLVEVEGILCEVKNPARRGVVEYYQESLQIAISEYEMSVSRWSEKKRGYFNSLKTNVKIAPFVLGWLRKPEDNDEYLVIKGHITPEELKTKRDKEAKKNDPKKRARKKPADSTKRATSSPKKTIKKGVAVAKKPATTSKPVTKGKSLNSTNRATMGPKTEAKGSQRAQATKKTTKATTKKTPVKKVVTKKAAPKRAASKKSKK